jgi:uncharacterized circularly permuted ATP-grasp superfamily protein/uncharacterized alpha-E superfamily protein
MTSSATSDPLAGYQPFAAGQDETVYDEMVNVNGGIRDHWAGVASAYRALGLAELARRRDEIALLLERDGVTYNAVSENHRPHRAWTLDPIPLIVPNDEWVGLERGMIQRAELLDLVLKDLYGERRLLRTGLIAPEIVLSDPQFIRSCDGIRIPGAKQLVVFGTDLARSDDGRWLVLRHRAQAPSGMAYAIENRRVLSRVFPQLFRASGVERLTPSMQALRAALVAAAPIGVDDPSVVILSPGSLSETAFEHASLAAQLGFPLVEGSDLTVRHGQVGLRAVGDWVPVHVILRRVDASFCDPLDLRSDSRLGIPGLVDVCRAGRVSVVNTLGSGVLENAALDGLMSTLSKHLLGTDLILDSAPSWWCGDPASRSHVLAHLSSLVVRPLSPSTLAQSIDMTRASAAQLEHVRLQILAQPEQWVGQERLTPSSAPVLASGGMKPQATVLRTFAIAHGDSYVAMAGGLAQASTGDDGSGNFRQAGTDSKDTWVLTAERASREEFWPDDTDRPAAAHVDTIAARAAEHLFWLGRYAERAEATVRLIRTINARRDEFENTSPGPGPASLTVLLEALTRITGTYPGFVGDDAASLLANPADELFSLVVDEQRPGTVAHAVHHMVEAIDVLRDQLSVDTWLVVGSLVGSIERLARDPSDDRPDTRYEATANVLDSLLHGLLSLSGLANESMVRDHGWQFMEAGRRIERALHITTLAGFALGSEHSAPVERLLVEAVLTAGESIITSRRRYRSRAVASTTIDLLFGERANPRSLCFQIDRLDACIALLRVDRPFGSSTSVSGLLAEVRELVDGMDSAQLAHIDDTGYRRELDHFVRTIRSKLSTMSDAIGAESFTRWRPQYAMTGPFDSTRPVGPSPIEQPEPLETSS